MQLEQFGTHGRQHGLENLHKFHQRYLQLLMVHGVETHHKVVNGLLDFKITREITETPEITNKNWCHNKCCGRFVETRNDRIVSVALIPFIRARTIEIDATNLKPNSNHYFYFDNMTVDKYVRPHSATYSQDSGTTASSL